MTQNSKVSAADRINRRDNIPEIAARIEEKRKFIEDLESLGETTVREKYSDDEFKSGYHEIVGAWLGEKERARNSFHTRTERRANWALAIAAGALIVSALSFSYSVFYVPDSRHIPDKK